jgi:hypothetical protein
VVLFNSFLSLKTKPKKQSLVAKTKRETTSNSQDNTMIISDISHIEVAAEDNQVQGGISFADANANASAYGTYFASSRTSTYTNANDSYYYYYGASASSGSSSSSVAD